MTAAARAVLAPAPNESVIQHRIGTLLDALGCTEYVFEAAIGSGRADILLPRQRTVIEVKAHGAADGPDHVRGEESPFAQLDRYVRTLIDESLDSSLGPESARPWTGILTDGRVWHRWTYAHRPDAVAQPEEQGFCPTTPAQLADWLAATLAGEPVGLPWIPANPVALFREAHDSLRAIHEGLQGRRRAETDTKIALWQDILRSAGMDPATAAQRQRLFVAHSFLIALARGVIHTITAAPTPPHRLLATGIVAWIGQTHAGRQWIQQILARIGAHEWRQRQGDVLRPLYEAFVDAADRRDFGEVYTPDWLAASLATDLLDDAWCARAIAAARLAGSRRQPVAGVGVLDPCCGSGTFLYHAARRLLAHPELAEATPGEQATLTSRLVCGIDIHPVAGEFARATLLRALPCAPQDGPAGLRIWTGDSLMLRGETDTLFAPRNGEIVVRSPGSPQDVDMRLPGAFVHHGQFGRSLERMVQAARDKVPLPPDIVALLDDPADQTQLQATHAVLTDIIAREGNAVWAWYILQMVGPYELARRKVDRILSNPPWVRMATIQHVARKRRLEACARTLALWQGGNQAPHFDIAQLFIKQCRTLYLQDVETDPAAWVVKHAAIGSGNWAAFRAWRQGGAQAGDDAGPDLTATGQILDLAAVQVFGGGDAQKCCVLIDNHRPHPAIAGPVVQAHCPDGRPTAGRPTAEAMDRITWQAPRAPRPVGPSAYDDTFRQGATIVPHVLTLAATIEATRDRCTVRTRRSSQPPWNQIDPLTVTVPRHWLVPHLRSDHLLPFALAPDAPDQAIVPLAAAGGLLTDDAARQETAWAALDAVWREYRTQGTRTPATLLGRLDFNNKLSRQLPLQDAAANPALTRLLYPGSGDVMRGGRTQSGVAIIGHTLFDHVFETAEEAAYLVALLNAPALREAFKQAQSSGRHFQLRPWRRVPIPRFDPAAGRHRELAALCTEAEAAAQAYLEQHAAALPGGQVGRSNRLREHLTALGLFDRLDEAARRLLPDQCRPNEDG